MRSGLSLVEIVLALGILIAVLVPLFGSLHSGIQGTERVSEESIAANHAAALLERLGQIPYRQLALVPAGTPEQELGRWLTVPGALAAPPRAGLTRYVTVEQVSTRSEDPADGANSEDGNLKRVRVQVRWRPGYLDSKSERAVTFEVLVTDDKEVF